MHGEGTGRLNEHSPGPEEPKRVDGAGLRRIALSAAAGVQHPALAMHKHAVWPPACSAVTGIANGVESS
jgi:hypothetical protein